MNHRISEADIAKLSPVQKMDLADVLYDIAQQEMEAADGLLTGDQLAEIDRRSTAADAGEMSSEPWDVVYTRLRQTA